MNNAPLRLAALAAAVAVLAHPAAARSDAAFAAGLAKPLPGLAAMAQLKTQPQTPPAPQAKGPVAPAAAWKAVLALGIGKGKLEIVEGQNIFTIKDDFNHPDGTYYVFNLHVLAVKNGDGSFRAHAAQMTVQELRALPGNAVGAEHWFFNVSGAGRLDMLVTVKSVTRGGVTKRDPEVTADLAAAETKEQFEDIVGHWHEIARR